MRTMKWLLPAIGSAALLSTAAVQGVAAASPSHRPEGPRPATILRFDTMSPVTGPYVGAANPLRGIPGGGLPWIITAGKGSLKSNGDLFITVRGLVLADQAPVPVSLRGINPVPQFHAVVSCQSIGASDSAVVANVTTAAFAADSAGNSRINADVSLPHPS